MTVMMTLLSPPLVTHLEGGGSIDVHEFTDLMRSLGMALSLTEAQDLLCEARPLHDHYVLLVAPMMKPG